MTRVRIGFLPLVDSAGLVVAEAQGFAAAEGLTLDLIRERSWAHLHKKLLVGAVDAAHLLAPMAVASHVLPHDGWSRISALMSLSVNGNAISVSRPVFDAMAATGLWSSADDLVGKGRALASVIAARTATGQPRLKLAAVHAFSSHHYELRYFLAAAGIDPDLDVEIVVVPPPEVVQRIRAGEIDGFCVGAPWTMVGVREGISRVIAVKPQIWRFGPEKVLAMCDDQIAMGEDVPMRLIRAVRRASEWADDPGNRRDLAALLASPRHLHMPHDAILASLSGTVPLDDAPPRPIADYIVFDRGGASFPWRSHAQWFYSQMVRWGQVEHSPERLRAAANAYRPDLFRGALHGQGVMLPNTDSKVEGALAQPHPVGPAADRLMLPSDGFFDGRIFDPSLFEEYVQGFRVPRPL